MKSMMLALAIVTAPFQTKPCNPDDVVSAGLQVVACAKGGARELEPSNEPARDIALAALEGCGFELALFNHEAAICGLNVRDLNTSIRRQASDAAVAEVVRLRARR